MSEHLNQQSNLELHPKHDIQSILQTAILRNSHLAGRNLRVEMHDREIVLKGVVGSYYQKQLAQEAIRGVSGNNTIRNELDVLSF